ncbi:MAG: hypothetical protein HOG65_08805, partial [Acidiferrobacteraceae bacterium]|nr:hypothetical protein [Acidiferrobacteraceae bacterium]
HSLGGCVGLGYIEADEPINQGFIDGSAWEIEVAGERVPATASLRPLYDPGSSRVRM